MTIGAREEIYIGFFREKDLMSNPYLEDTEERLLDMGIMDTIEKEMIQGKNNTMKKHVTDIKGIEKKLTNQTTYTQPQPMSNEGS